VVGMKQGEKYDEKKVAERHRDHSLFIVFAPVENPRIALMAIVENGGFGARAAAPIARTVLDYYLLGKLPEGSKEIDKAGAGGAAADKEDEEESD
jgi:penicillin-binding protein 2